ncbi:MAG TPA: polymer-forming cytoskeletal protein [Candidatus Binataceae bacterium]|nr:polymer-forming cytoskeletal protein [Candidatus Binataceae bacterium]
MRFADTSSPLHGADLAPGVSGVTDEIAENAPDFGGPTNPAWVQGRTRVAVNRNMRVAGHLVFQEPIRIEGHFRGEVSSSDLVVISEGGSVGGRVRTPRLLLLGELEGDITASKSVVLGPRARFTGRLEADNVTIYEGAYLDADMRVGRRSDGTVLVRLPGASA